MKPYISSLFKDLHLQWEPMDLRLIATDRVEKSESIQKQNAEHCLGFVFFMEWTDNFKDLEQPALSCTLQILKRLFFGTQNPKLDR